MALIKERLGMEEKGKIGGVPLSYKVPTILLLLFLFGLTFRAESAEVIDLEKEFQQGRYLKDRMALAAVMVCEADNQGRAGMLAVASVVMNRVKSDKYPNSIHDVVYQPKQFTCIERGKHDKYNHGFYRYKYAFELAGKVMQGGAPRMTIATMYHADWSKPNWDYSKLERLGSIGNHVFYVEK